MAKTKTPHPFKFKQMKRAKINGVKISLRKYCTRNEEPERVFFYEVKGSDGSYFKTPNLEKAEERFEQLKAFEQRQLTIN